MSAFRVMKPSLSVSVKLSSNTVLLMGQLQAVQSELEDIKLSDLRMGDGIRPIVAAIRELERIRLGLPALLA